MPLTGDFVPEGGPVLDIWSRGAPVDADRLLDCLAFADERTIEHDAAFGFRQIVDIAERALSRRQRSYDGGPVRRSAPRPLHRLARRDLPSQARVDGGGHLRVIAPRLSWEDYVSLAFDEIRLYSGRSVQVVRRLRGALNDLLEAAPPPRKSPLHEQLRLLDRDINREFDDELDQTVARRPANVS